MTIVKLTVRQMRKSETRYPDADAVKQVSDVYVCECTTDDGIHFEASHFIYDTDPPTPARLGNMLKMFGEAIGRMRSAEVIRLHV